MKTTALVTAVFGELVEVRGDECNLALAFQSRSTGTAVVGDVVSLERVAVGEGEISWRLSGIEPRERCLWRATRRRRSHLVVANVDRLAIVLAIEPPPKTGLVDRYLVAAEAQSIPVVILLNKMDLAGGEQALADLRTYSDLGYEVSAVSALTGQGLEGVRGSLSVGLSVLVGHSGVGKSALLNRLVPDAELRTRELSEATGKGVHTTSVVTAHPFEKGILVDTPGIREFGLIDVGPEDVSAGFREIAELEGECRFSNCSHREEPGCAIRKAVEEGGISLHRYESYLRICESLEAGER